MKQNPARWFEIYVQDINRARKFYEAVLELSLEKLPTSEIHNHQGAPKFEIWAFPMLPDVVGCGGALVHMEGFPSGGNSTLIYFGSNDCSIESGRVVRAGGKIEKEKFSIGQYGFIALCHDTEGNMFGIHSME